MSNSLSQQLYYYLKSRAGEWINGGELERYTGTLYRLRKDVKILYKMSNASRRLRELVGERIERKEMSINGGTKSVYYRYVPSNYEKVDLAYKNNQIKPQNNTLFV